VASTVNEAHEAQLLNYLKATGLKVERLLNCGPKAPVKRRVFDQKKIRFYPNKSALIRVK
jgi:hypothetical protein